MELNGRYWNERTYFLKVKAKKEKNMDFFIKTSHAAAELKDKVISNSSTNVEGFFDDPRIMIMFLSLILSVVSLGWQIKKHYQDKSDRKKDFALSIKEGYWHQSVVLPLFVDTFVLNVTQWIDVIDNPDRSSIDEIRDSFKKDIRELTSRTRLLCTVEENVKIKIRELLDGIEDCITCYLSDIKESTDSKKLSPNDKVFAKVEEILKELMNDHQRFNH